MYLVSYKKTLHLLDAFKQQSNCIFFFSYSLYSSWLRQGRNSSVRSVRNHKMELQCSSNYFDLLNHSDLIIVYSIFTVSNYYTLNLNCHGVAGVSFKSSSFISE